MNQSYFKNQADAALVRARFFEQAATVASDVIWLPNDAYLFSMAAQRHLYRKRQDDIAVDPNFAMLWRRFDDLGLEVPLNFAQRYADQKPLRQAWLGALAEPRQGESVSNGDRGERILRMLARERVLTRSLLMQKLSYSLATISRDLKNLFATGWIEEQGQSAHSGRPQQILRLSPAGLERARALGEQAEPAPEFETAALAERLFHQAIEQAIRKHLPEAQVARAYSGQSAPSLASPLGTIVPDLVVTSGWNRWVIEAETGKYNYRRLADKLDKYLASSEREVLVVTENQAAPTLAHIRQWQHQLQGSRFPGASLRVKYATMDNLKRHGLEGNIWQICDVGTPKMQLSVETGERSTLEILRDALESEGARLFWGTPAVIPNSTHLALPEFIADGTYVEEIVNHSLEADVIALVTARERDDDEIVSFLDDYSAFLESYVQQVVEYGPQLRFAEHPWLYGTLVLVHDVPGQDSPADLARAFPGWRTALQDWQASYHPLRVGIVHASQIGQCTHPSDLKSRVYDLCGFC